jgi:uncharacterized membrane protein
MSIDVSWTTVGWVVVILLLAAIYGAVAAMLTHLVEIKQAVFAMHAEVDEFVHPDKPPIEHDSH